MSHNDLPTKSKDSTDTLQVEGPSSMGKLAKVVGSQVQDIRGNAKWDAIKAVVQNHEKWLPYVASGWAATMATLAALIQLIRGVPIDWLITGVLAAFSAISFLAAFLFYRRGLKRLSASLATVALPEATHTTETRSELEQSATIKELNVKVKELEREKTALEKGRDNAIEMHEKARKEIDVLQFSLNSKIKDLESYAGLDDIVNYQRKGLRKYVIVEKLDINLSHLSAGKRYVEFVFHIRNYSIFYVSIPMSEYEIVKGSIHFKGDPLSGEAKIVENKATGLPPYVSNYFKVWQWVNQDEAKEIATTLEEVGNLFDFSKTNVYVKADRYSDDEGARLDLTRGMQNAELENKVIELKNANARLRDDFVSWQVRAKHIEELTLALGACYHAYNQAEREESLTDEAFKSLKMRISHALSTRPNEPKVLFDFYDALPPVPDSPHGQKEWIDKQCFRLRELIAEQRE